MPIDIKNADRNTVAKIIGIDARHITRLFQEKIFTKNKKGKYDLAKTVQAYLEYKTHGQVNTERIKGKNRLDDAKAEKEELIVSKLKGESILIEDAKIAINEAMVIIGTQLDGVGGRMASELAGISEPAIIRKKLLNETRRIREAAADRLARLAVIEDSGKDSDAAAKPKRRSVGKSSKGAASRKR